MICNHHIRHLRSLVIATSVLLANTALAETFILKPGPGSSIQALIDGGVADGDVIQLEAGDFTVNAAITLGGRAIVIRGTVDDRGEPATRLVGVGETGILACRNGEGADTVLEDLVVTGGDIDLGGGLLINEASPTARRVHFIDNQASVFGGAVAIFGGASAPLFEDCRFDDNRADLVAGGCLNGTAASPVYRRCSWTGNEVGLYGRAVYNQSGSLPTLEDCVVLGCCQVVPPFSFSDAGGNQVEGVCSDCSADFNCYGGVGAADLGLLLGAWGTRSTTYDLDGDGVVGGSDIGVLVSQWGDCQVFRR